MSESERIAVTIVFFFQLALIVAGSLDVMRRCRRAWRMWGAGEIGTALNWSTALAAASWAITLTGWAVMFLPTFALAGVGLVLLGQFVKLVSILAQRRGYDALYGLALTNQDTD